MTRRRTAARRRPNHRWRWLLLIPMIPAAFAGWRWLDQHPQHNPFAPLRLDQPIGFATSGKLTALVADPAACRAILGEGGIPHRAEAATGTGACRLGDRTRISPDATLRYRPAAPVATCAVHAGLLLWQREVVEPAAQRHFDQGVIAIDHFGTASCRRMRGGGGSGWSEHASGNAIDIAAFRLAGGRQVRVLGDWQGDARARAFLREVRDGACRIFGTTLSPDYNAAHRDHFHLDMADRSTGALCR